MDKKTLSYLIGHVDKHQFCNDTATSKEQAFIFCCANEVLFFYLFQNSIDARDGRTTISPSKIELAQHIIDKLGNKIDYEELSGHFEKYTLAILKEQIKKYTTPCPEQ